MFGSGASVQKILDSAARRKRLNAKIFRPLLQGGIPSRLHAVSESGLTRSDVMDKVKKIYGCAGIMELRAVYTPDSDGVLEQHLKVHTASYCQQYLVCPICAKRVQTIRQLRYEQPIRNMIWKYRRAYFLTFTVKDGPFLRERLEHLKRSVREFMRLGQKRKRSDGSVFRSGGESSKLEAGFLATEVKKSYGYWELNGKKIKKKCSGARWVEGSQMWHAHAHGLFFTDEALDYETYDQEAKKGLEEFYGKGQVPKSELNKIAKRLIDIDGKQVAVSKLSDEWRSVTGDSISLHAVPVYGPGDTRNEEQIWNACRELLKYPVKQDYSQDEIDTLEIIEETYGKRFLSTYGDLRKIGSDEFTNPETEDSKEIYSVVWEGHQYGKVQSQSSGISNTDMTEEKRRVLGEQAKIQGAYRKQRREILARVKYRHEAVGLLDEAKEYFRENVRQLWRRYKHRLAEALEKIHPEMKLPPPVPIFRVEQVALEL